MNAFQPKLLSARPRVSAALQSVKLTAPKYTAVSEDEQVPKKKKKGVVAALMAATGNF